MVLDVAGPTVRDRRDGLHALERLRSLELGHDRFHGAPQVVGEDGEPPTVRHPEDDLVSPAAPGERHQLVDHGDHRVQALDREHLLTEVGALQVALELEHLDQAGEQRALLLDRQRGAVGPGLDPLPQPHPLLVGRQCSIW